MRVALENPRVHIDIFVRCFRDTLVLGFLCACARNDLRDYKEVRMNMAESLFASFQALP